MAEYTVTEILHARPWPIGEDPPKVIYYDFKVDGEERQVNIGRKPGNALTVGMKLEGHLEPGDRGGLKFKAANGFAGSGGPRGKSPEERKSIAMQASQKVGVDVVRIAVDAGLWKPETPAAVAAAVRNVAAELFAQVDGVSS